MSLEKVIVGTEGLEQARKAIGYVPTTEIDFVSSPSELISRVQAGNYQWLVTDLNYTPEGKEGFGILESFKDVGLKKVLWTADAYNPSITERGESLGAEVLASNEIVTLVGQLIHKAPLKKGGGVLIYYPDKDSSIYRALNQVFSTILEQGKVTIGSSLRDELESEKYGLVIDTSTLSGLHSHSNVGSQLRNIRLREIPRIVTVSEVGSILVDMLNPIGRFYRSQENSEGLSGQEVK